MYWNTSSFPLVQAGYLIKGRFSFIQRQDKSLGLEAGGCRQGPRLGGWNPEPGGGNLEAGSWRLRELLRSIKFLVEFGVVYSSVNPMGMWSWPGRMYIDLQTCFNGHVFGLSEDGHMDVILPSILMALKWIIRKNHHDETLPPWWGLVGVSRKFDGEARNVCIEGDASANTPDACDAPDPGVLRGRILARLRIRRMRRFNKTRRPKLRILMLDSAGLACAS
ncbi:hypothetical protein F2Q69_00042345 [Brassica cretica]|uniref:Uncharacterized protein n=1 Tax=Brassica cretica TaxID=69181 RepID=A0A8S9NLQ5_BRACR|nr:hypothetical protein F2Q69_00042345 [Brassica cretica]